MIHNSLKQSMKRKVILMMNIYLMMMTLISMMIVNFMSKMMMMNNLCILIMVTNKCKQIFYCVNQQVLLLCHKYFNDIVFPMAFCYIYIYTHTICFNTFLTYV